MAFMDKVKHCIEAQVESDDPNCSTRKDPS